MYFYDEDTENSGNNCILNSESKDSAPDFFVDENEALVDYASFDNCYEIKEAELESLSTSVESTTNIPGLEFESGIIKALPPIVVSVIFYF